MYKYINKMLSELPTYMNGSAKTLAAGNLFNINPEDKNCLKQLPRFFTIVFIKSWKTGHKNCSRFAMFKNTSSQKTCSTYATQKSRH